MSPAYSLKEAFAGLWQAKISTTISIMTVSFMLMLLSVFGLVSYNLDRIASVLNVQVQVQAFISDTITEQEIGELSAKILDMQRVEKIDFVSKKDVVDEFKQEFGEELFDILDENPLPSSFLIKLFPASQSEDEIKQTAKEIELFSGISEVIIHGQALGLLNRYTKISKLVNLFIVVFVSLGSLLVVSNTIRLIIFSRRHNIETMKLVGATNRFIRQPFYLEGIFQGVVGGVLASALVTIVFYLIKHYWANILCIPSFFALFIVLVGGLFGLLGSVIAIKKFL
jgi:cell division transport system permease protein